MILMVSNSNIGPNDVAMHYDKLVEYAKEHGIHTLYAPQRIANGIQIQTFPLHWNT